MKAIIVDDEFRGREVLNYLLKTHCPQIEVIGQAEDVTEAYDLIMKSNPDIVFLDIEMPGGSGFDLLQKFSKPSFTTIFVTSYDQYAIQAIKHHAFDYLLKPVIVEDLKKTISNLIQSIHDERHTKTIEIVHKNKIDYIETDSILYLAGDGNYSYIYLKDGSSIHTSKTLKEFEDLLCIEDNFFIRIHKGYIVNAIEIKNFIKGDEAAVELHNGIKLEVSRRRKDEVKTKLAKLQK